MGTQDVEAEARSIGWRPQDQFKGDPEKWVDAETFLDRGRNYLPILRSNNAKLQQQYDALQHELQGVKSLLAASQDSIAAMKEFHTAETARQVREVKKQLVEKLKQARDDGNVDDEASILDELSDIREAEKSVKKEMEKPTTPTATAKPTAHPPGAESDPELVEWISEPENSWFGRDAKRTSLAIAIGQELRADPANAKLLGKAFYSRVAEEVAIYLGEKPASGPVDRVAGSRTSGGGSATAEKSYSALPLEARQACDSMARRMVGEGRAFKDAAAWRAHYTKVYFSSEE